MYRRHFILLLASKPTVCTLDADPQQHVFWHIHTQALSAVMNLCWCTTGNTYKNCCCMACKVTCTAACTATCWTHAGSAAACQDAYLNDAATVALYHNCTASGTGIAHECAVLDENSCTILDVHCTCRWWVVGHVWHLAISGTQVDEVLMWSGQRTSSTNISHCSSAVLG